VQANRRQSGGTNFGEKLKGYVEENIAATHKFIKQLTQAKDFEAVLRNQKEFVRSQFEAFGEQAKTLGETTLNPHSMPVIRAPLDELTDTFRDTILRTRAL
jgi:hypothetical protein